MKKDILIVGLLAAGAFERRGEGLQSVFAFEQFHGQPARKGQRGEIFLLTLQ